MLIEPYVYVRTITIGLGTIWFIQGLFRLRRFMRLWKKRLIPLGIPADLLRKAVLVFVLRTTVLDPINLGLLLLLIGLWGFRAVA